MWTDKPGGSASDGGCGPCTQLLMTSPDGTLWAITVNNSGVLQDGLAVLLTESGAPLLAESGDALLVEA